MLGSVFGAARGAAAGLGGSFMRSQAGGIGYMRGFQGGNALRTLATGGYGYTATGAFYGGAWGAMSDDTSVLGGAAIGGGLGGLSKMGVRAANLGLTSGIRAQRYGYDVGAAIMGGFGRRFSRDASVISGRARNFGSRLASNAGHRIQSTLKQWG